ncbi:CD209 antigen-like protein C isoform X2 [Oncorhynchus kisutch]|uniref:CD209 antigen-like protein C isoform X2 n=1 Tax=Oncorhynchus kisutch TaxID=8019 RepID=UPI0012DF96CA|nr:CD209 antigen-like protein C isoform X2 [Oncorhynchus kisutch]
MSEGVYEIPDGFEDDEPDTMKNTDIDGQIYANVRTFKPSPRDGVVASEPDSSGKRLFLVAAVCLGLLCVLLAGIIGLSVYYDGVSKSFLAYKTNTSAEIKQLLTSHNNLTKERYQIQTSYNTLTKERDHIQTRYNTLTKERDQLQNSYSTLTKKRDRLQTSYNTMTKERDKLQTEIHFLSGRLTNLSWQKFESSWYFLSTESKTWKESREDCLKRGADLVIINSDKEQTFLFNLKKRVWIGLNDSVKEGTWKWVDGTPLTTRYWYSKQPDNAGPNGDEDCAEIHKDQSPLKAWNDMSCDSKLNWICEKAV